MKIEVIGKRGLSGWLEIAVAALMAVGVAMLPAMWWVLQWMMGAAGITLNNHYYVGMVVLMEYSDALALAVLWSGRKILRSINRNRPFSGGNARRIRVIAVCCGLLAAGYVVYGTLRLSYFAFVMALAFLLMCLVLIIGAELFRAAVEFKEENDLTI